MFMQNRRTFLKMGVAGSAFLPVFADLSAKAEQKDATVKRTFFQVVLYDVKECE